MSIARRDRSDKKQKGQFLTPYHIAKTIVDGIEIDSEMKILEPSFGKDVADAIKRFWILFLKR